MRNISTTRAILVASEIVIGLKSTRWCRRIGESPEADIGAKIGFKTPKLLMVQFSNRVFIGNFFHMTPVGFDAWLG